MLVCLVYKDLKKLALIVLGAILIFSLGISLYISPAGFSFLPPCLFHELTGLYCPFCGGTRAVHQLLHGNIPNAFAMNPLVIVALVFSPLIYTTLKYKDKQYIPLFFVFALLLFGIIRNLPFAFFNLLTSP